MKHIRKALCAALAVLILVGLSAAFAAEAPAASEEPADVPEVTEVSPADVPPETEEKTDTAQPDTDGAAGDPHTITVETGGKGTVSGDLAADAGDSFLMITVTPNTGYAFDECTAVSGIAEGEFEVAFSAWPTIGIFIETMPDSDVVLLVTFTEAVTASWDANGGIPGELWRDSQVIPKGQTRDFEITDEIVKAPEGKEYDGVEVNGVRYGPTDSYTFHEDVAIVYQWKDEGTDTAPTCIVTLDPNGGTTGPRWEDSFETGSGFGAVVEVRDDYDILPPSGKEFAGLEVNGTVYGPGEAFPVEGEESLTAKFVWKDAEGGDGGDTPENPEYCTMMLDPNGGTPNSGWIERVELEIGSIETVPDSVDDMVAAPEGKEFAGLEIGGVPYAPGETFTVPDQEEVTVKFLWKDADDGTDSDSGDGEGHGSDGSGNSGGAKDGGGSGRAGRSDAGKGKASPRTGDDTAILPAVLLLAVSAAGLVTAVSRKRETE